MARSPTTAPTEYTGHGDLKEETVYLNGLPVATIKPTGTCYIHTHHLGTPRQINAPAATRWTWDIATFGATLPNQDPRPTGIPFHYNLRFPGQYSTGRGLHYNGSRCYDPLNGRYLQSDPIGLRRNQHPPLCGRKSG